MPKLGYKYLNFQILVIKVYFLRIKKISAHNLSGGADTQNFSHTLLDFPRLVFLGSKESIGGMLTYKVGISS